MSITGIIRKVLDVAIIVVIAVFAVLAVCGILSATGLTGNYLSYHHVIKNCTTLING